MGGADIDLDRPAAAPPARAVPLRRASPTARAALLLLLALAAAAPPAPPALLSIGRRVPLPSYCTGVPIPGGRLDLIHGEHYEILDATTNTVINEGTCPHPDRPRTGG